MHEPHDDRRHAPAPLGVPPTAARPTRRDVLAGAGVGAVSWLLFEGFAGSLAPVDVERTAPDAPARTFEEAERRTLAAACDRLLPSSPGSPGARDVNAIGYLDAVLQEDFVGQETVDLVRRGGAWLDARARAQGAGSFADLDPDVQVRALEALERWRTDDGAPAGHAWLETMLRFVLEAFLGDPSQGGNPGGIGWQWAGHEPGFPRPGPDQERWRPEEIG